jgi:hypothetical protein
MARSTLDGQARGEGVSARKKPIASHSALRRVHVLVLVLVHVLVHVLVLVASSLLTALSFALGASDGYAKTPSYLGDASTRGAPGSPLGTERAALTDASARFVISKDPPDPAPLRADAQWVFDLRYERGEIVLLGVYPRSLEKPVASSRAFGRFALELWEMSEGLSVLVERIRFDFPLLGAGAGTSDAGDIFAKGLVSRIGVTFPQTTRGDRLELVDRATGIRRKLDWPPPKVLTSASDAGSKPN